MLLIIRHKKCLYRVFQGGNMLQHHHVGILVPLGPYILDNFEEVSTWALFGLKRAVLREWCSIFGDCGNSVLVHSNCWRICCGGWAEKISGFCSSSNSPNPYNEGNCYIIKYMGIYYIWICPTSTSFIDRLTPFFGYNSPRYVDKSMFILQQQGVCQIMCKV